MLVHLYTCAGGCLSESLQARPEVVGTQHWSNCSKTSSDSAVQIPQSSQGIVGWGWLARIYCHNMHLALSPASFSVLHIGKYAPLKSWDWPGDKANIHECFIHRVWYVPWNFSKSDPPPPPSSFAVYFLLVSHPNGIRSSIDLSLFYMKHCTPSIPYSLRYSFFILFNL